MHYNTRLISELYYNIESIRTHNPEDYKNLSEEIKETYNIISNFKSTESLFDCLSTSSKQVLKGILLAFFNSSDITQFYNKNLVKLDRLPYNNSIYQEIEITIQDNINENYWNVIKILSNYDLKTLTKVSIVIKKPGVTLLRANVNFEENKIELEFNRTYVYDFTIEYSSHTLMTILLALNKAIKDQKEKPQIDQEVDLTSLLLSYDWDLDKITKISTEITLQKLKSSLDFSRQMRMESERTMDEVRSLQNRIDELYKEYMIKVQRTHDLESNFKDTCDSALKIISYHQTKTGYLNCTPDIRYNSNSLYITLKTNVLPVFNIEGIKSYLKAYSSRHSEEEIEFLNKIEQGEAFLAVCPMQVDFIYDTLGFRTKERSFQKRRGSYSIPYNGHSQIGTSGCLGTFTNAFNEAARELDLSKTIVNTINYLQSVSPLDPAGRDSLSNLLVLDEFADKIIYSKNHKELIGKSRKELSDEIW